MKFDKLFKRLMETREHRKGSDMQTGEDLITKHIESALQNVGIGKYNTSKEDGGEVEQGTASEKVPASEHNTVPNPVDKLKSSDGQNALSNVQTREAVKKALDKSTKLGTDADATIVYFPTSTKKEITDKFGKVLGTELIKILDELKRFKDVKDA